jgi:hypothetical protein
MKTIQSEGIRRDDGRMKGPFLARDFQGIHIMYKPRFIKPFKWRKVCAHWTQEIEAAPTGESLADSTCGSCYLYIKKTDLEILVAPVSATNRDLRPYIDSMFKLTH